MKRRGAGRKSAMVPIRIDRSSSTATNRWHRIGGRQDKDDYTEAMNVHSHVLIRSVVSDTVWLTEQHATASMGASMVAITDAVVAQRWVAEFFPADDESEAKIVVHREVSVISPMVLMDDQRRDAMLVRSSKGDRFRWYHADEPMPEPPAEHVRYMVDGQAGAPPTEADALRAELARLREDLEMAQVSAEYYESQRDHLLAGRTFEDATADNPFTFDP